MDGTPLPSRNENGLNHPFQQTGLVDETYNLARFEAKKSQPREVRVSRR
jgi:hypothetical protein